MEPYGRRTKARLERTSRRSVCVRCNQVRHSKEGGKPIPDCYHSTLAKHWLSVDRDAKEDLRCKGDDRRMLKEVPWLGQMTSRSHKAQSELEPKFPGMCKAP